MVNMKDIVSVSKEKTAKWIPNAIQISTNSEKVKFREFVWFIKTGNVYLFLFLTKQCIL